MRDICGHRRKAALPFSSGQPERPLGFLTATENLQSSAATCQSWDVPGRLVEFGIIATDAAIVQASIRRGHHGQLLSVSPSRARRRVTLQLYCNTSFERTLILNFLDCHAAFHFRLPFFLLPTSAKRSRVSRGFTMGPVAKHPDRRRTTAM